MQLESLVWKEVSEKEEKMRNLKWLVLKSPSGPYWENFLSRLSYPSILFQNLIFCVLIFCAIRKSKDVFCIAIVFLVTISSVEKQDVCYWLNSSIFS